MWRWFKHGVRFVLVTVGVIALTSFTIDATDALRGSQSALSILARNATEGSCPVGMTEISLGERSFCIDVYENSTDSCPSPTPATESQTQDNINSQDCHSASVESARPWTFVNYHQAKTLCARRGARLPTANEWYEAALSTPDSSACNINGFLAETGDFKSCLSARGAYDMVGNVWEWVEAEIRDGNYEGRTLPPEGYVSDADAAGVAITTEGAGNSAFGKDYFWTDPSGSYAMMRGGFYGSKDDAGVYAVHTKVAPAFSGTAIGFRCVIDL